MVVPAGPGIGKSKDTQVMGALKGKTEAPKKAKLTMPQIIESSLRTEQPDMDVQKAFTVLGQMTKTKGTKFVQIGNSVFMITPNGAGNADFHTFTVEPADTLVQRWKDVANTLKQMGFKHATSYATSPAINRLVQRTGLPVKISQSQQMSGGKMVPAFKYDLDL
jgi:hypothetical protein